MIGHLVAFLLGAVTYYAAYKLYEKRRPEGSPWRPDVRKWWGQNEDLIEVEARRAEEISRRDFEAAQHRPPATIPGQEDIAMPKSPVVKRIESYATPADQGQRDTPPHREGDRQAPVTLRQPGAGSEGRDAATSDHYRSALVLDQNVNPNWNEVRDADLVMRYEGERAAVIKDRHGDRRFVSMTEAEALLARSDAVLHRGEAHPRLLVAFDNDDPAGAWLQGQIAEYLGPVAGTDGQVHGFRLSGTGEVLDLTDPFDRGLVHRVLGDEPGISA